MWPVPEGKVSIQAMASHLSYTLTSHPSIGYRSLSPGGSPASPHLQCDWHRLLISSTDTAGGIGTSRAGAIDLPELARGAGLLPKLAPGALGSVSLHLYSFWSE